MYAEAGKNRQLSSFNALKKLNAHKPDNVLIHDAARPFCSNSLVIKIIRHLNNNESAIPYILSPDKKVLSKKEFNKTIKLIQTPQGFKFNTIFKAHVNTKIVNAKDDSVLIPIENLNFIKGEKLNIKIGFITPMSNNFCATCNRVRISSTGKLYMCLGQNDFVDFREILRSDRGDDFIKEKIRFALSVKPKRHDFIINSDTKPYINRHMNETGG